MEILEIIKIVIVGLSIIWAIFSTVYGFKKGKKRPSDFMSLLNENIIKYMQNAETVFSQFSSVGSKVGSLKETDVLSKLKIDCFSQGIEYDEKLAKEKIAELIEFSKNVNK